MTINSMTMVALAAGAAVGGLTWFGWELLENLAWRKRELAERARLAAEAEALAKRQKKEQEDAEAQDAMESEEKKGV